MMFQDQHGGNLMLRWWTFSRDQRVFSVQDFGVLALATIYLYIHDILSMRERDDVNCRLVWKGELHPVSKLQTCV